MLDTKDALYTFHTMDMFDTEEDMLETQDTLDTLDILNRLDLWITKMIPQNALFTPRRPKHEPKGGKVKGIGGGRLNEKEICCFPFCNKNLEQNPSH